MNQSKFLPSWVKIRGTSPENMLFKLLWMSNKLPQHKWFKTTTTYYLSLSLWVRSLDSRQYDVFFLVHNITFHDLNLKAAQCYFCHILFVETVTKGHLGSKEGSIQSFILNRSMLTLHFKKSMKDCIYIGAITLGKSNLLLVCIDSCNYKVDGYFHIRGLVLNIFRLWLSKINNPTHA